MTEEIKQRIEIIKAGKVPVGYKKTQFGVFPDEWVTDKTLGDMFLFYGGLGISREQLGSKGIAYLHYGDMHKGTFKKVSYEQYSLLPKYDIQLDGNETFLMKDGDIAFLDASEDLEGTSRSVLIDNPDNNFFIAGLHTTLGKSKDDFLDKWYKQYITTTDIVKKQFQELAVGFKVYGVNRKEITKIVIPCPSKKDEQNRIAKILSKWDKAIESQEKLIEKLELQKKALMQRLLTPEEDWEKVNLGEICSISTGKLDVNAMRENGKYPFFTCSKQIYQIDNYAFDCEALLIAGNGDIGDIKYYYGKFNAYQRTYVLNEFTFPIKYVLYYLENNFQKSICLGTQKSSMPYIKLNTLLNSKIYYTPNKIKSIISLFETIDKDLNLQRKKLNKLMEQQKAMQQLLLTGIVRV